MHLTQPAVSIQLKNLQDQFEIPLTEVVGRQLYVTEFGKEIAAVASEILSQVALIDHKTLAFKGKLAGRFKLSVVSTGKYVIPYFLSSFMKQHPGVELIMQVTNKSQVIGSLEENAVDFGLASILPPSLQVDKIELLQNNLYLVGNQDYRLKRGTLSPRAFQELPLIYREEGSGTRQAMEQFFRRRKMSVKKKMELTSNEAVKQAVIAGLGVSIMPLIGIKNELHAGDLCIIPVAGLPIKTNWQLIWLKGKKHSPIAQAFLQHLRKEKETIVSSHFDWYERY